MIRVAVLVVAAIGFGASPDLAQAPKEVPATKEAPPVEQSATVTYLREAAIADMFGIEAAKLALDKSRREDVRDLAKTVVGERGDGLRRLKDLTAAANLEASVPKSMDKVHENRLDELRKAEGSEFDRTYLDLQMKSQETALALHSTYARATDAGPLNTYATEMGGIIERHLQRLRQVADVKPARS